MADVEQQAIARRDGRWATMIRAAEARGLLGAKDRQLGGRFPGALVEEAERVTGITADTELLTYALIKVALEDGCGERLLAQRGKVPKGTLLRVDLARSLCRIRPQRFSGILPWRDDSTPDFVDDGTAFGSRLMLDATFVSTC